MSQKRSAKRQKRVKRKQKSGHLGVVRDDPSSDVSAGPLFTAADDENPDGSTEEPDLLSMVETALDEHPVELLMGISSLISALDPRSRSPFERASDDDELPSLEELVATFLDVDLPQTTAALHVLGALAENPVTRRRIARAMTTRHHRMPDWLPRLGEAQVYRAVQLGHVLGDGENVFLGARLATGEELTAAVYVDHNLGTLVKDAFPMAEPINEVVALMVQEAGDPDITVTDLELADARAKVEEAIAKSAMTFPPIETDTWPGVRPLVEWLVRDLPEGGTGYPRPVWTEKQKQRLAAEFFASSQGEPLNTPDHRDLLGSLLWFGTEYSTGDPLRWSPVAVEILLLAWLPRKVMAPEEYLALAPELLRAFVRYCHGVRQVRSALTEETLAAVGQHERDYLDAIGSLRPQHAALAASLGLGLTPRGGAAPSAELTLSFLERYVGDRETLMTLDTEPLPDEPFDWSGIPDDIHDRVTEILEMVEAACGEYFNTELRTACRRFLHRVAVGDQQVFRGKGQSATAAAAVCWTIGRANEVFSLWGGGPQVQELMAYFGIKGSASQRAARMMRAAGIEQMQYGVVALQSPDFLEARRRGELIEQRDRHLVR